VTQVNAAPSLPGPQVLLVEDELPVRRFLRASLPSHGYRILEATTAAEALQLATMHVPDLVLLDLGLPDGDGLDVTKQLRGWSTVPILVLSARGQESQKVAALDAGADDYLVKPFGLPELLARMRVALRHAARLRSGSEPSTVRVGPLAIDFAARRVTVASNEVHLTPIEYKLLSVLARYAGRVVTHNQLLEAIWGPGSRGQTHYLRVHMTHLRHKLESDPLQPRLFSTEAGVGYRLRDDGDV